jgi:hypothetical protein
LNENTIYMFGIPILDSEYCDCMEDGTQYQAEKWHLSDMEKYIGKCVVIGFDGSMKIYEETGEEIFDGSLLDSTDFVVNLKNKLNKSR